MLIRIVSLASKQRIYHKDGCPYISKMGKQFKKCVDIDKQQYRKYRACKYCGGNRGWARIFHKRPEREYKEKGITCWYENDHGFEYIYLRTKVGLWKAYWKREDQRWLLFHLNRYDPEKSSKELMRGKFHRQGDVPPSPEFDALVNYIASHDRNKAIASVDYRKLPQKTKQQKKIFKHYKKKADRSYKKHMDKLFESIKSRK